MSRYDRDAIEIYILDHIDTDNYGKQFKYDREYLSLCLTCSRMSIKNISKGMVLRKLLRII